MSLSITIEQMNNILEDHANLQKKFTQLLHENEEKDRRIQILEQELTYESDQCGNLIDENENLKKELEEMKNTNITYYD